jgi:uncharacterized protein with HEPN domain
MPHDPVKLLHDIVDAAEFIVQQTRGWSVSEYERTRLVRDAVERNFIIIGEALSRLTRIDPTMVQFLGNFPQMIAFRNVVVHGYEAIDDAIVWGIIQNEVPRLLSAARVMLDEQKEM